MTFLKQLKVVIASPNDVSEERETLNTLIQEVNNFPAEDLGLILRVVRWDTDAYPGFHADGPQGLVDEILKIKDCDILIGIFWKRFGTPTTDGRTGTEHEFHTAYEAWRKNGKPHIMLYFNQKEYFPKTPEESKQQTAVLEFKRDFPKEGLYWEYTGLTQFQKLVSMHLTNYLRRSFSLRSEVKKKPQESIKRDVDKLSERIMLMASGKHCFVIMPYTTTGDKHTAKYWHGFFSNFIKPAVENLGYTCKRTSADPGDIMKAIVSELVNSDLVLAVLTDYSPNVFYELGIRHSLKHGSIMMLESGQHVPFDIAQYGVIYYEDKAAGVPKFQEVLRKAIQKIESDGPDNPVQAFLIKHHTPSTSDKLPDENEHIKQIKQNFIETVTENGNIIANIILRMYSVHQF